jgi:galactokinase/galacturonokinase
MEFSPLEDQVDKLVEHLKRRETFSASELNIISSPYRISPLGAHIDHQGAPVLGMTINARTLLAFIPNYEKRIRLYSTNYPGVVEFSLDNIKTAKKDDWGRYAMGAVKVIQELMRINIGFTAVVTGSLPASGLSSSASVGLAYLKALSHLNNLNLTSKEYISLDSEIENKYLKLQVGILDQSSIVYGKKNCMLHIDTLSGEVVRHPKSVSGLDFKVLILYSGLTRELTYSAYNERVEACKRTAGLLGLMGGLKSPKVLSDIPSEVYEAQKKRLPQDVKNWAIHYFSEVTRVEEGIKAWDRGDIEKFGELMNESSISTLENYDKASSEAKRLFELTRSSEGVYGATINGGGYGGCVVAFVSKDFSENSAYEIISKYNSAFPQFKEKSAALFAESEEGLELL